METRQPPEDDPRTSETARERDYEAERRDYADERRGGPEREARERDVRERERPAGRRAARDEELAAAHRAGVRAGAARTLAQSFCLILGLALIAVGILGFIFGGSSFDTGDSVNGEDFLIFSVNGWHNVVHIATGAFLVLMAGSAASAALGALIFGVVYAVVCVIGFASDNDLFDIVAIDDADNWLHLGFAVLGIFIGVSAGALGASARRDRRRLGLS